MVYPYLPYYRYGIVVMIWHWTWNDSKNRGHRQKHHLSFETAQLVFDDPLAAHRQDLSTEGL